MKKVKFPESVEDAKKCVPGPNVIFSKDKDTIHYSEYLNNIDEIGSLGCGPNKYPKYENGKYCCVDKMSTNQETLDYINNLLENAMDVTSITSFKKESLNIEWLLNFREDLLRDYPDLTNNISVPESFISVEDWFNKNLKRIKSIPRFSSIDDLPGHMVQNRAKVASQRRKNIIGLTKLGLQWPLK